MEEIIILIITKGTTSTTKTTTTLPTTTHTITTRTTTVFNMIFGLVGGRLEMSMVFPFPNIGFSFRTWTSECITC